MKHLGTRHARGSSLLEALVALVVTATGVLALAGLHGHMRLQAEHARQRSEALLLAQSALESARRSDAGAAWATLSGAGGEAVTAPAAATTYERSREVSADDPLALKTLAVAVRWADRTGRPQQARLQAAVAELPPALAGALALGHTGSALPRPRGRHPAVPAQALDLGGGRSAFRPAPGVAWVFDNLSARITGVCSLAADAVLDAAAVAGCTDNADGQLLSGHVRFLGLIEPAAQPAGTGLNLDVALALASSGHPSPGPQCFDDAPVLASQAVAAQVVRYHCMVPANAAHRWSGRSDLVPRTFDDAAGSAGAWALGAAWQVCRYSAEGQSLPNTAHPAQYLDVTGPLAHQNFLVVPAERGCPADATVTTAAHQP